MTDKDGPWLNTQTDVVDAKHMKGRYFVGRDRNDDGTPYYSGWTDEGDFVWFWQKDFGGDMAGIRYTPEQAEQLAVMLMFEAKLARENNERLGR